MAKQSIKNLAEDEHQVGALYRFNPPTGTPVPFPGTTKEGYDIKINPGEILMYVGMVAISEENFKSTFGGPHLNLDHNLVACMLSKKGSLIYTLTSNMHLYFSDYFEKI